MIYDTKDLIKLYFKQLTVGCECGSCDNDTCKTCRSFKYKFDNPNEAAVEAIHLTLRHPANPRLCDNMPKNIDFDESTKEKISNFNKYIGKMIRKEITPDLREKAKRAIQDLLQDPEGFPYALMTIYDEQKEKPEKNKSIAYYHLNPHKNDLLLNETVVCDIPVALKYYSKQCQLNDLNISFTNLVNDIIINDPPNTAHHVRSIILLFCMTIFFETDKDFDSNFLLILKHALTLPDWAAGYLSSVLSLYPSLLSNLLDLCRNVIEHYLSKKDKKIDLYDYDNPSNIIISATVIFINIIYDASQASKDPMPTQKFAISQFETILKPKYELRRLALAEENRFIADREFVRNFTYNSDDISPFIIDTFLQYPCVVPFNFKMTVLLCYLNNKMNKYNQSKEKFVIRVRRDRLTTDTINRIQRARYEELFAPISIVFDGEAGIDMGGLTREFFHISVSEFFSPKYHLFQIVNNRFYWFCDSLCFDDELQFFSVLGTLVGLAVYNRIILPIRFPLLMYKKILGKQLTINDMAELDQNIAQSLNQLIEYRNSDTTGTIIEDMCLTFSVTIDQFDEKVVIPFYSDGESTIVTNDTLDKYIQDYIDYKLNTSVSKQFSEFANGFRKLCRDEVFSSFTPDELDILVSGEPNFNWEELKKGCRYDGYSAESKTIKMFWDIFFNDFNDDDRCKLLLFITGNSRAPVGGFKMLHLKITKAGATNSNPKSHTCFNTLELPNYTSKAKMVDGLKVAIQNCVGFGMA